MLVASAVTVDTHPHWRASYWTNDLYASLRRGCRHSFNFAFHRDETAVDSIRMEGELDAGQWIGARSRAWMVMVSN